MFSIMVHGATEFMYNTCKISFDGDIVRRGDACAVIVYISLGQRSINVRAILNLCRH